MAYNLYRRDSIAQLSDNAARELRYEATFTEIMHGMDSLDQALEKAHKYAALQADAPVMIDIRYAAQGGITLIGLTNTGQSTISIPGYDVVAFPEILIKDNRNGPVITEIYTIDNPAYRSGLN